MKIHILWHGASLCGMVPDSIAVPGGRFPLPPEDKWTSVLEPQHATCAFCLEHLERDYEVVDGHGVVPRRHSVVQSINSRIRELEGYIQNGSRFITNALMPREAFDAIRAAASQLENYRFALCELRDVVRTIQGQETELDAIGRLGVLE